MFSGKGSSSTTVQSYQPTEYEMQLQKQAADYSSAVAPNALNLNNLAGNLMYGSYGSVQADYDKLNQNAQSQISSAQNTVSGLVNGELPSAYLDNMTNAIQSTTENTIGGALSGLANKGVLNSSVTNQALNDIKKNTQNTIAQNYLNNISTLNGLAGQQSSLAGQGIITTAGAQEAAQQPALNLWNASLGLNGASTSALGALSGTGTTTSTQNTSGGSMFGGILSGLAGNSALFCFAKDTMVKCGDKLVPIQDLKVGDNVTVIGDNGEEQGEVLGLSNVVKRDVYNFVCDNGEVKATLTQPFKLTNGEFYIPYKHRRENVELANVGKLLKIEYVGNVDVYDIKASGSNVYVANGFYAYGAYDNELRGNN